MNSDQQRASQLVTSAIAHDNAGEHQAAYEEYMQACELLAAMVKKNNGPDHKDMKDR